MRSKAVLCTVAIAATLASSLSFAQPRAEWRDQRQDAREARHDVRDAREGRREVREDRREARTYYNARGPEFRRGYRLPPEVRGRPYVVRDWRAYHLAPPARGYEWIQVGPDFVLAAIATGVIATVVLAQ